MSAIAAAVESLLARWSANAPDWNAAMSARMPMFSIVIDIRSSIRPKPDSSLRARRRTPPVSAERGPGLRRALPDRDELELVPGAVCGVHEGHGLALAERDRGRAGREGAAGDADPDLAPDHLREPEHRGVLGELPAGRDRLLDAVDRDHRAARGPRRTGRRAGRNSTTPGGCPLAARRRGRAAATTAAGRRLVDLLRERVLAREAAEADQLSVGCHRHRVRVDEGAVARGGGRGTPSDRTGRRQDARIAGDGARRDRGRRRRRGLRVQHRHRARNLDREDCEEQHTAACGHDLLALGLRLEVDLFRHYGPTASGVTGGTSAVVVAVVSVAVAVVSVEPGATAAGGAAPATGPLP